MPEPSEELFIQIADERQFPTVDTLLNLAHQHRRIVVEMPFEGEFAGGKIVDPALEAKLRIIELLQPSLTDHAVTQSRIIDDPTFRDPGFTKDGVLHRCRSRLSIRRIVSINEIEAAMPRLVEATREFRRLANDLMTRQAAQLGVDPAFFAEPHAWNPKFEQTGQLDDQWQRFFHGFECGFHNIRNHQSVEVRLGFQLDDGSMEFGVLERGFFGRFIRSTRDFRDLDELLRDDSTSASRALTVLAERGHLRRLDNPTWHIAGWVAID